MNTTKQPNIIVIIMDDLGYYDLGCHGNPHTQTPNLDRLANESVRLEGYRSGPLCTPARAALMTGRYPYRTRAIDTYCGRSMIDPSEVTLPERLKTVGYHTAISGKWHLGDNYPMRPTDKGFDEALTHLGGGLHQPANHGRDDYFHPELMRNNQLTAYEGYCTDIFTDFGIEFIQQHHAGSPGHPFFLYLATNAPHTPAIAKRADMQRYLDQGMSECLAAMYAMVDNIDWNVGRLLQTLNELEITDDTIVVYTSDHGPGNENPDRYMGGLNGWKCSPFEGGLKTPCFMKYPGRYASDRKVDFITNPMDLTPTLLNAAGVTVENIDGIDLTPWICTANQCITEGPKRDVVLQWHRGDVPELGRGVAMYRGSYKWLQVAPDHAPELYDLSTDHGEQHNLIDQENERAQSMRDAYLSWFEDVSSTREDNYAPPRIVIGTEHENPTVLSANDWRVEGVDGWKEDREAHWLLTNEEAGDYEISLTFETPGKFDKLVIEINDQRHEFWLARFKRWWTIESLSIPAGDVKFKVSRLDEEGNRLGARRVSLKALSTQ